MIDFRCLVFAEGHDIYKANVAWLFKFLTKAQGNLVPSQVA